MMDIPDKFFSLPESEKQVTFHMQSCEHLL